MHNRSYEFGLEFVLLIVFRHFQKMIIPSLITGKNVLQHPTILKILSLHFGSDYFHSQDSDSDSNSGISLRLITQFIHFSVGEGKPPNRFGNLRSLPEQTST